MDQCVYFARDYYRVLAEFLPGDTTLNELRVLTAVAEAASKGEPTSVSEIADVNDISRATVSRLITQWMAAGQITEEPHPKDGRRRRLSFTGEARDLCERWARRTVEALSETPLPPRRDG